MYVSSVVEKAFLDLLFLVISIFSWLHPDHPLSGMQAHTSTAFRIERSHPERGNYAYKQTFFFYPRTFLLEHHCYRLRFLAEKRQHHAFGVERKRNNLFMTIEFCQSIIDHQTMGESVDVRSLYLFKASSYNFTFQS